MARRGRPSKPVTRHKREGTYRPDRHGERDADPHIDAEDVPEPDPEALQAPEHLDEETQDAWRTIARSAAAAGVDVQQSDTFAIESAAVALVNARRARTMLAKLGSRYYESRYGVSLHPAVRDEKGAWEAFHKSAALLGLSPLDRERLVAAGAAGGAEGDADPLADVGAMRQPLKVVNGGKE